MRALIIYAIMAFSASAFTAPSHADNSGFRSIAESFAAKINHRRSEPSPDLIMQEAIRRGRAVSGGAYLYVFDNFSTLYDCNSHPIWSAQMMGPDKGNVDRTGPYAKFFTADDGCAPRSAGAFRPYRSRTGETINYHRGHLLSFNGNENSRKGAMSTNAMVNITPQSEVLNLGAYRYTEYLEECYREQPNGLFVVAGAIDGVSLDNVQPAVNTPELIFKVVVHRGAGGGVDSYQAWLFPNDNTPTSDKANDYLISINQLESIMSWPLPEEISGLVSEYAKKMKPKPWPLKIGANGALTCGAYQGHSG